MKLLSPVLRREALPLGLFVLTALTFLPVIAWLTARTVAEEQLRHAFIVLGLAVAFLVIDQRLRLRLRWDFGSLSGGLLAGAYAATFLAWLIPFPPLAFPGLVLALASLLIYLLGREVGRMVGALLGAFGLYTILVIFLPVLDWPLRGLAGQGSGWLLSLLGKDIQLQLHTDAAGPHLLLFANEQPFLVAPECNGFGVLTASLLLSLLLVLYKPVAVFDKILLVLAAGVTGILFNFIRIIIIVLLAPAVGMDNYFLMHEIVGSLTYYSCLLFIWWLIQGFPTPSPEKPAPDRPAARAA